MLKVVWVNDSSPINDDCHLADRFYMETVSEAFNNKDNPEKLYKTLFRVRASLLATKRAIDLTYIEFYRANLKDEAWQREFWQRTYSRHIDERRREYEYQMKQYRKIVDIHPEWKCLTIENESKDLEKRRRLNRMFG